MSYLKLKQMPVTSFQWEGQTFKVVDAPVPIFDAFLGEVYEEITDIDRNVWDIYARWDILNDAIGAGDLVLLPGPDGAFLLEIVPPEEKDTDAEEKAPAPELQTSGI